jgi:hypothetical protein
MIRNDQKLDQKLDQTQSNRIRHDQTLLSKLVELADSLSHMIRQDQIFIRHVQTCSDMFRHVQTCSDMFRHVQTCFWILKIYMDFLNIFWDFLNIVLLTDAVLKRHGGLEKTGQS